MLAICPEVLADLAEAGVEIEGNELCCDHCNATWALAIQTGWWLVAFKAPLPLPLA